MKSRVGTKAQPRFGSGDKPALWNPSAASCLLHHFKKDYLWKPEEPGRARPFLVATLFPMCHFNTSDQRKYRPPPNCIPSLWSCTNHHSYKVEHCKTSCAHICMSLLQNLSFFSPGVIIPRCYKRPAQSNVLWSNGTSQPYTSIELRRPESSTEPSSSVSGWWHW